MSQNWLRAWSLSVNGQTVTATGPTALRVVFHIKQWHSQAPNMASFRVYNVSPSTLAFLQAAEGSSVQFMAGYESNMGLVFSGNLKQTIAGHETAVDSYVDIFAADGDQGYNQARVTKTLNSGYTPKDKLQAAVDAMGQYGVTMGTNTLDLSSPTYPRGTPLVGMARDIIRSVALSAGGIWSIQNGQVTITDKSLQGASSGSVTMDATTGLIGWPKQTSDGIEVTSLLNPQLQPLQQITLDPSSIIAAEQDNNPLSSGAAQTNQELANQQLGAGTYTIFSMSRSGDSRGQDWYDHSMCIGAGGALPSSQSNQGYSLGYS